MLQLLSASAVVAGTYGNWTTVDVGNTPLYKIYQRYSAVLLRVYDTDTGQNGYVDLYTLPVVTRSSPMTLNSYLAIAVGLTVMTVNETATRGTQYVAHYFASAYGYTVKGFNNKFHEDTELLPDQKIDALLYHPDVTDYRRLQASALFTVNGLVHRSDISDTGVILYQGGRTITLGGDQRIGVLDFSTLGNLTTVPITDAMIKAVNADISLYDVVYFDLPEPLEGKTVFLVLGGVLFAVNPAFDVVGSQRVKVHLSRIKLIDQFYKTYQTLDLSELPLTRDSNLPTQFVVNEFKTDAFVRAYLKLSQSFFVVLDTTGVTVQERKLDFTDHPGIYRSWESALPDLPVRVGDRFAAYNVKEQDGFWTFSVPHATLDNKMKDRGGEQDSMGVNYQLVRDQNESYHPHYYANAEVVYITKE